MKSKIKDILAILGLLSSAVVVVLFLFVSFYPFNLVSVAPEKSKSTQFKAGSQFVKTLRICKQIDSPIDITLEFSNGEVIPLAYKVSYAPKGCKNYIISQNLPETLRPGQYRLLVVVGYKVLFREINQVVEGSTYTVTN